MKKYSRIGSLVVAALALLIAGLMIGSGVQAAGGGSQPAPQHATDQVPYRITIQGKLPLPTGVSSSSLISVTFRLYDAPDQGNSFFVEHAQITPEPDGLFIYQLGTNSTLPRYPDSTFARPVYLGITIANGREQPRQPLSGAAYAMSLIPGANIVGDQGGYMLKAINNSTSGFGIYGSGAYGLVGYGNATDHSGGAEALSDGPNGIGVGGIGQGPDGVGLFGSACLTADPCQPSAVGAYIRDYNGSANAVGMQVIGVGQATGGFVTGGGYALMVRYHGSSPLHAGDVLALDGNNETFANASVFGTIKADATNAGAAIGVATHRYNVITATAAASKAHPVMIPAGEQRTQVDEAATTFQSGDLIQVVVVGQAQMKVSGNVKLGDHLTIGSDVSIIVAAKDGSDSFGKVAGKPDANGTVSVFVNFK